MCSKNFCVQAKGGAIAQCPPPKYATAPIAAKVCAARWRTALVNSSPILPNQSQRSSFAVIGYAGAGCRRLQMTS